MNLRQSIVGRFRSHPQALQSEDLRHAHSDGLFAKACSGLTDTQSMKGDSTRSGRTVSQSRLETHELRRVPMAFVETCKHWGVDTDGQSILLGYPPGDSIGKQVLRGAHPGTFPGCQGQGRLCRSDQRRARHFAWGGRRRRETVVAASKGNAWRTVAAGSHAQRGHGCLGRRQRDGRTRTRPVTIVRCLPGHARPRNGSAARFVSERSKSARTILLRCGAGQDTLMSRLSLLT